MEIQTNSASGQPRTSEALFWSAILVCTLYQSYRYPLQINSSGTSPTYSDTPLVLQAGKFALVVPFFTLAFIRGVRKRTAWWHWIVASAVLFMFLYSAVKVAFDPSSGFIDTSFWLFFSLVLTWSTESISIYSIERFFRFLFVFSLITTLVQVTLFFAIGRLPALAYSGGFVVRFGSFLDDPNGFAAICFLLLGWALSRFRGSRRFWIIVSILLMLILTQSWTAIVFLFGALLFGMLVHFFNHPLRHFPALAACLVGCTAAASFVLKSRADILRELLESKQQSASEHVIPLTEWLPHWAEWFLVGNPFFYHFESWWAGSVIDFGIAWFLCAAALFSLFLFHLYKASQNVPRSDQPVFQGLLLFGSYVFIGSLNLPFPSIFPINVLFFAFSFLVIFGRISYRQNGVLSPQVRHFEPVHVQHQPNH